MIFCVHRISTQNYWIPKAFFSKWTVSVLAKLGRYATNLSVCNLLLTCPLLSAVNMTICQALCWENHLTHSSKRRDHKVRTILPCTLPSRLALLLPANIILLAEQGKMTNRRIFIVTFSSRLDFISAQYAYPALISYVLLIINQLNTSNREIKVLQVIQLLKTSPLTFQVLWNTWVSQVLSYSTNLNCYGAWDSAVLTSS